MQREKERESVRLRERSLYRSLLLFALTFNYLPCVVVVVVVATVAGVRAAEEGLPQGGARLINCQFWGLFTGWCKPGDTRCSYAHCACVESTSLKVMPKSLLLFLSADQELPTAAAKYAMRICRKSTRAKAFSI